MITHAVALVLAALPGGLSLSAPSHVASRSLDATLPIYRNASHCVDDRVEDLLSRMTLEEKAGQMFQTQMRIGANYTLDEGSYAADAPRNWNSTENMVGEKFMTHFNLMGVVDQPGQVARWYNLLQQRALDTRLGIPITLSTDPRHHFTETVGTGVGSGGFSQWPEPLGFAALRDAELVRKFADIAREEYISVGLRSALHPQVDLATEPRWARIVNSWSEDAELTSELIVAYIKGFQGETLGPSSVTTVTKHFPGGGTVEAGEDSHFIYGQNQTYPGNNQDYHLIPFKAAFAAGARQIMPYYSRPIGTKYEEVGFSFNRQIVTELLREELGFEGIVVTDWGLITDVVTSGHDFPARAWGMQNTTALERAQRILDAGCDQFGGENRPELVVELVNQGTVTEDRIDVSVRRLLREKFILGLFENPFVDPEAAERVVGNQYFVRIGEETQRRSYSLLSNNDDILPVRDLALNTRVYAEGFNTTLLELRDLVVVETPEEADLALLRLPPPHDPRNGTLSAFFGFRPGSLEYTDAEKQRQAAIYAAVPTIVDVYVDRPVAIPEVIEQAAAVLASFGASGEAFLDIVFGLFEPEGKLPFDLPRSNAAVEAQMEDVPFDTRDPVFKFGHGLRYRSRCAGNGNGTCQ